MSETLYRHIVVEAKYFWKTAYIIENYFCNYWTDQTKIPLTKTNIEYDLFKPKELYGADTKHFFGKVGHCLHKGTFCNWRWQGCKLGYCTASFGIFV